MKNQVDPDIIIYTVEENFKDELSKPKLRNLVLQHIMQEGILLDPCNRRQDKGFLG